MSRENITVFYRICGDESVTRHPNVLIINIAPGKEVFLVDILAELPSSVGYMHEFWAQRSSSGSYVLLKSPACLVPMIGNTIILYLDKSHASPYVPVKQIFVYNDSSRSSLYSVQSYVSATKQSNPLQHSSGSQQRSSNPQGKFYLKRMKLLGDSASEMSASESVVRPFSNASSSGREATGASNSSRSSATRSTSNSSNGIDSYPYKGYSSNDAGNSHGDREGTPLPYSDTPTQGRKNAQSSPQGQAQNSQRYSSDSSQSQGGGSRSGSGSGTAGVGSNSFQPSGRSTGGVGGSMGLGMGGIAGINADDIANAASQAAKNIFSFAALSLKTAVEAGQAVVASQQPVMEVGLTRVTVVRELAQGGFGVVYLVQEAPKKGAAGGDRGQGQGKQFALKQILCQSREEMQEAHAELKHLQLFSSHPHIVSLLDHSSLEVSSPKGRIVRFLFPLYPHGTAWDCMERAGMDPHGAGSSGPWPFLEARAVCVCRDMSRALSHLHQQGFAHRDMKPHNILLSSPDSGPNQWGSAVLTDLGSVCASRVSVRTRQEGLLLEEEAALKSSAAYRPPELTTVRPPCVVCEGADIWALGCTLFCLAFGRSPFEDSGGVQRLGILNARYSYPHGNTMRDCKYSAQYVQLVDDMLQVDPTQRLSADDVTRRCDSMMDQ